MSLISPDSGQRWVGNALDLPRIYTVTIANTWATNDTVTVTVNDKDLTVTVGTSTTVTDVAAALVAAIMGNSLVGDESRNTTGTVLGEWYGVTATNSAGVVTITGRAGHPFTATASETTAGDGTASLASVQAPTGKHWADNDDNYSTGTAPADGTTLAVKDSSVSILYGLSQFSNLAQLDVYASFTGDIGLPDYNVQNPSYPFRNYSATHAPVDRATAPVVNIGMGPGSGSSRMRIDFNGQDAEVNVYSTGSKASDVPAALELVNIHSGDTVSIYKGDVEIVDPSAQNVNIGYASAPATDVTVKVIGDSMGTVNIKGGTLTLYDCDVTTINAYDSKIYNDGDSTHGTVALYGTTVWDDRSSQSITTIKLYDTATFTRKRAFGTKAITNDIECYSSDITFDDPNGTIGAEVLNFNSCRVSANLDFGPNRSLTLGTP